MKAVTQKWDVEDLQKVGDAAALVGVSRADFIRRAALAAADEAPAIVARRLRAAGVKLSEIQGETE